MTRRAPRLIEGAHILTSVVEVGHWVAQTTPEDRHSNHKTVYEVCITLQYTEGEEIIYYHVSEDNYVELVEKQGSFYVDHPLKGPYGEANAIWTAYDALDITGELKPEEEEPEEPEPARVALAAGPSHLEIDDDW